MRGRPEWPFLLPLKVAMLREREEEKSEGDDQPGKHSTTGSRLQREERDKLMRNSENYTLWNIDAHFITHSKMMEILHCKSQAHFSIRPGFWAVRPIFFTHAKEAVCSLYTISGGTQGLVCIKCFCRQVSEK